MTEERFVRHDSPAQWNDLVAGFPITSALQTWGWGEAKRLTGWEPSRLELPGVGAVQVLRRRLLPGQHVLYAPRGPALFAPDDLPRLAGALRAWARPTDVYATLEPECRHAADAPPPPPPRPLRPAESVQPEHTAVLDLTATAEERRRRMHPMLRRHLRASERQGVRVEQDADLSAFWPLFDETNRRSRLIALPRRYYEGVVASLGVGAAESAVLTARLDDEALASAVVVGVGTRLYYLYGGSTRTRSEAQAPIALQWGAMQWAIERGYTSYDLWGVPRQLSPDAHAYGVALFKTRLGGTLVRNVAYDLPLTPLYRPLRLALRARRTLLNLRALGHPTDVV